MCTMCLFHKQVSIVGAVYLVGYMQWSVAWLIGPVVLSLLRDRWRRESEYRRSLAKAAAQTSEKDVVLARLDDLPAWVSLLFCFYICNTVYIKKKQKEEGMGFVLHCKNQSKLLKINYHFAYIIFNCHEYTTSIFDSILD